MVKPYVPSPIGVSWVVTWPLSFVFAAMIFLCAAQLRDEGSEAALRIRDPRELPQRIEQVTQALKQSALDLPPPIETQAGSGRSRYVLRVYETSIAPEQRIETDFTIESLRTVDPGLYIDRDVRSDGTDYHIGLDGLLTHTVRVRWAVAPKVLPRVTIIAGDLGDDLRIAREFVSLDVPVTLGVRPFRPFSREVAELGRLFGREVLLQISLSYDEGEAFVVRPEEEFIPQLDAALARVPYANSVLIEVAPEVGRDVLAGIATDLSERNLRCLMSGIEQVPDGVFPVATVLSGSDEPEPLDQWAQRLIEAGASDGLAVALVRSNEKALANLRSQMSGVSSAGVTLVPLSAVPVHPEKPKAQKPKEPAPARAEPG